MRVKNAFTAFGLDADEATIDTLRTDIAVALRQYIERSNLGQTKAGEKLGLPQNIVSQIVRGEIEHLSVERLIKAMVRAKLPGYAEWGESAEDARAGSGYRPTAQYYTPVVQTAITGYEATARWDQTPPENNGSSLISGTGIADIVQESTDGG